MRMHALVLIRFEAAIAGAVAIAVIEVLDSPRRDEMQLARSAFEKATPTDCAVNERERAGFAPSRLAALDVRGTSAWDVDWDPDLETISEPLRGPKSVSGVC